MELSPHDRLCSWLALPPGSWPPDHYALLGLARGTGDFTDIEARVLDRMELLRPHQLLHPDEVTEGMNRLAQALVCLTDPVARADYDRSLGIPPPPFEVVEDEEPAEPAGAARKLETVEMPFEPGLRPPGEPRQPAYEVVEPEEEADKAGAFEVVEDEEPLLLPPAYEEVPVEEEEPEPEPAEAEEPAEVIEPAPPARINRRAVYRRLAAIRKALRAWEGLRPVLGTPTEALATPVAVLLFVQALAAAREALPGVSRIIRGPNSPGGKVAALVRLPHVLHTVRTLLASQRQAVALDWRRGYEALRREQRRLRELTFAARPGRRGGVASEMLQTLRRTPEWILLFVAVLAILLAFLRRNS